VNYFVSKLFIMIGNYVASELAKFQVNARHIMKLVE